MSRSGYTDDFDDDLGYGRWRGMVASAIRGKRGQKLLRDLLAALDAMPVKALITNDLENTSGEVCALGALGRARNLDMSDLDPEDSDRVAEVFDIARPLACEIVHENDEVGWRNTPEQRFARMREWVASLIKPEPPEDAGE